MIAWSLLAALIALGWTLALVFSWSLWWPTGVTLACVAAALGRWAFSQRRKGSAKKDLAQALARDASAADPRAALERERALRSLAGRFERALSTLRSSKLQGQKGGALYGLPWYLVLGPSASGKSTAVRQAGLNFPLAGERTSMRGVDSTQQCDWWLSNEAVLVDTAGRYFDDEHARDEWLGLLDMLRSSRPRRPLNGVLLAIDVSTVHSADDAALARLAHRTRARLDELLGRLGMRLPVYVLLTKCDRIAGFRESFQLLSADERKQLLGFTLAAEAGERLGKQLERCWSRMTQALERRAVFQVGRAESAEARRAVHAFPQQLELLGARVHALLSHAFVDNVYRDAAILRGVYLSSGIQEGTCVDLAAAKAAQQLGVELQPREQAVGRASYFLPGLFSEVVLPDRGLAREGALARLRVQRLSLASTVALLALAVGFASSTVRAFSANRDLLRATERDVHVAARMSGDAIAALAPLRARLASLRNAVAEGDAWHGLDQGRALIPALRDVYTAALRESLVAPLLLRLEAQLASSGQGTRVAAPTAEAQAALYDRTKAYLLLTQPKSPSEPQLDAPLAAWLARELASAWEDGRAEVATPSARAEVGAHFAFYLELLIADPLLGFTRNHEAVRVARAELSRLPPVDLALDRVVAAVDPQQRALGLEDFVGATGLPWHATRRVRAAFTRRLWEDQVRPLLESTPAELMGEHWVTEAAPAQGELRACALRAAYFAGYVDEWRRFLNSIRVEEPSDQARALAMLQDLTRGQPAPIERLMRTVADNAQLSLRVASTDEGGGLIEQLRKRVATSAAAPLVARRDPCADAADAGEHTVRRALEGFFSFGASIEATQPGAPPPSTSAQIYQEQLTYVRDALQAASDDPTQAEPLLTRLSSARTRVRSLIEAQQVGWRPRFEALLWPAVQGAAATAANAVAGEQARTWCSTVVLPFARTLRDRYPFARTGQDAALADLADFYRPATGTLWSYHARALDRDLPRVGSGFEARSGSGVGAHYSPEVLRFLHRAQGLTEALFPPRAEQPRVDFELRVRPSPGIAQVLLTVDGQTLDFHNGPERWVRMSWPGQGERRGAALRVRGEDIDEKVVQDGEWGLFRLLEQANIAQPAGERFFSARWHLHTQHDVVIDVRPARAENPLVGARGLLDVFRGPGSEVPRTLTVNARACRE